MQAAPNPHPIIPRVGVLFGTLALLVGLGLDAALAWAADPIGKLIVAAGRIEARAADGTVRRLRRQAEIYAGDTLITGGNVFAQLRMVDGALIQLRPDTEFKIEDYRWDGVEDGTERGIFKLLKGGFRTITGAIGHKNKQNYQVSTPVATIGIRGTHYGLRMVTPELAAARSAAGDSTRQGLYGGVVDGKIAVRNGGGEQTFGNDRYFFVANANTAPETLLAPPGLIFDEDQSSADGQDGEQADADGGGGGDGGDAQTADAASDDAGSSGDGQSADAGGGETATDGASGTSTSGSATSSTESSGSTSNTDSALSSASSGVNPDTTAVTDVVATSDTTSTSSTSDTDSVATANSATTVEQVVQTTYTRAPSGAHNVVSFINSNAGTPNLVTAVIQDDGTTTNAISYRTGSSGNVEVTQIATTDSGSSGGTTTPQSHTFNFGTATLAQGGKHTASGASWGRWSGSFVITTDGATETALTDLHFLYADSVATATDIANAASRAEPITLFDFASGATTSPTDLSGNVGTIEYFTLSANFATQLVTSFDIKTLVGGRTYQASIASTQTIANVLAGQSVSLTGTCTGCGTTTSVSGNGTVTFLDSALNYVGASYGLLTGDNVYGVVGAGVLEKLLTTTTESVAPTNAVAHLAFVTKDGSGNPQRQVMGLKQDGTNDQIKTATVNSVGNVVTAATENIGTTATNRTFQVERSGLVDTGGGTVGVNWGRWTDGWGASIAGSGTGASGHAHFIYSDQLTSGTGPTWTTATFNYVGGTSPTDENGNVGSLSSASMNVDLTGTPTVTAFNVVADFSASTGRTWTLSGAGATISQTTVPMAQIPLTGTCSGCATNAAVGDATMDFVGAGADYAISGFGASTASNAEQVVGTLFMQRAGSSTSTSGSTTP